MQKKQFGNSVVVALVLLNVVLWLIFPPPDSLPTSYTAQWIGEVMASSAMILMSITIFLANKPRFIEPYFGGLDQMYQTHKQVSMLAFFLLIGHFFVIPDSGELVVGKPLGMLAFAGIIVLVLLTIAPRVPLISRFLSLAYHKWRVSHKLLGLFFMLGLVHYLLVGTISKQTTPGLYMLLIVFMGILAYLYKQLIASRVRPYHEYVVEKVRRLNGTTVELSLNPVGEKVTFNAGQFLFVHFEGDAKLSEPHPFTVSSAPHEESLRLSIRASGDWTRYLTQALPAGTKAKIDGCYGMFNYKSGGKEQIWIAGGIGVTPFLSWLRDAGNQLDADVDFFYGVRGEADALFWDEFQAADHNQQNFRAHLQYSSQDGHLSADQIAQRSRGEVANKDIYMCGPISMVEGFRRCFKAMGVPANQIHYEEFNFR
jgi:predicted ferric reductase